MPINEVEQWFVWDLASWQSLHYTVQTIKISSVKKCCMTSASWTPAIRKVLQILDHCSNQFQYILQIFLSRHQQSQKNCIVYCLPEKEK